MPVIKAMAEKTGLNEALSILCEVNEREAYARGKEVAEAGGGNDIQALVEEVEGWGRGGVWEMEVFGANRHDLLFRCDQMPLSRKIRGMGVLGIRVGLRRRRTVCQRFYLSLNSCGR